MMFRIVALATFLTATSAVLSPQSEKKIVNSILNSGGSIFEKQSSRRLSVQPKEGTNGGPILPSLNRPRRLAIEKQEACDSSFLRCLPDFNCVDCFATLELEGIDWTGVTPDMKCADVVKFLNDGDHCKALEGQSNSIDIFCATFDSCVVWENSNAGDDDDDEIFVPDEDWVNCTALTECEWPGMKKSWIGDGICNDNMHGCYNTALCQFDGGDCCEDTCEHSDNSDYKICGSEGFKCRNPESENCDSSLTNKCKKSSDSDEKVKCKDDEQKYRLNMYDSFGDGWDTTMLTITATGGRKKEIFKGQLKDGSEGVEYICLSKSSECYTVQTNGGTWGVEVSWEINPMRDGLPAVAAGGAPATCDFPVAGSDCEKTCNGKPDVDPTKDKDYKTFKDLYNCIKDKCLIQLGACQADDACEKCFEEDAPDYCYGIDTFVAVIDCTMCSCTEKKGSDYCNQKGGPAGVDPTDEILDDDGIAPPAKCTPGETMKGANALRKYAECADLDEIGVMITDFDQNNFGQLDQFEACAHAYADEDNHGGHTALSCMQILQNAIKNPTAEGNDKNPPLDAIKHLANDLYNNAEEFCDCSKAASDEAPLCPSFMSFKTLLFESLDACTALDEIDCDAWDEFWKPCKENLEDQYGKSDFSSDEQCNFAKKGCSVGSFPAFRRLDCGAELEKDSWDFYKKYESKCLKGDNGIPPNPSPVAPKPVAPAPVAPAPVAPSPIAPAPIAPAANKPTPKPYIPSDSSGGKPYIPSDSSGGKPYIPSDDKDDSSKKTKKKSHWFRNLVILGMLGAGGYYVYKQRFDSFNFVQYRRMGRNFNFDGMYGYGDGGGDSSMYTNLNHSTTFEPPSLPPTPTMMGTEMT